MFVFHQRCAFAARNAPSLSGRLQLVGQISTAWCWRCAEERKFRRFYSTKIMYFINFKYDPQPVPGDALCCISPTIASACLSPVACEGARCDAVRPNKSRDLAPSKCDYPQRTGKIGKPHADVVRDAPN
jgi:hypothetical protein